MFSQYNRYTNKKKFTRGRSIFLLLILVPVFLLTACSEKPGPFTQVSLATPIVAKVVDDSVDYSGLQEFVQAINDQYVDEGLSLFNDDAILNEIDQVDLMANLHQNGWNHNYTGDEEIKGWLETEIGANAQLLPKDYKLYGNYPSMDGTLYYQDQVANIQLIEKPVNGKIGLLIYNILIWQYQNQDLNEVNS
jgi:hypothetical protein